MAMVKLIFSSVSGSTIQTQVIKNESLGMNDIHITIESTLIPETKSISLDKSTAIRFVKELKRQIALLD